MMSWRRLHGRFFSLVWLDNQVLVEILASNNGPSILWTYVDEQWVYSTSITWHVTRVVINETAIRVLYLLVKSLQLIWDYGICLFHLHIPDLQLVSERLEYRGSVMRSFDVFVNVSLNSVLNHSRFVDDLALMSYNINGPLCCLSK